MENLSLLLNTPEVHAYDVTRFDTVTAGDACLTAFWTVVGKGGKAPSLKKKSIFHAAAPSAGVTGLIEGQNRTLTEFSREIAKAIQSWKRG